MKIETNNKTAGRLAIILTLIYAFTTRSILAGFLYRTQIQLLLFYAITYLLLGLDESCCSDFFHDYRFFLRRCSRERKKSSSD